MPVRRSPTYDVEPPIDPDVGSIAETAQDQDASIDRSWWDSRSRALVAIVAVLAIEAALVVANIAFGEREGFPERLSVTRHLGVPELLVYLQWLLAAGVMWRLRAHSALYGIWALVLSYRLAADVFEFHHFFERVLDPGALRLFEPFGPAAAIKDVLGHVVDESALMILVLLALLTIGRRGADPAATLYSHRAIGLQALYVVFAVLGEWLFLFVIDDRRVAGILEEGGEMVAASLILGLCLLQAARLFGGREGATRNAMRWSTHPEPGRG